MTADPKRSLLEEVQSIVARPVRWAGDAATPGDFEGREFTLEVFDVPSDEQMGMFSRLRGVRAKAHELLGQSIRIVFHTPEATTRHYADVRPPGYRVPLRIIRGSRAKPPGGESPLVDDDVLGESRPPRSRTG